MTTKENVFFILNQNKNTAVSGEKLAKICNVSRTAIWKAIKSLRLQGFNIEGTTNDGYVLQENYDIFNAEILRNFLTASYPDFSKIHIECFDTIDSTNSYAKRILGSGKVIKNSLIAAESQTAGRGRMGRVFYSPSKTGIYLSIIYNPKEKIVEPAKITAFSAVALCRVINRLYKVNPKIKWVNDIYLNGKKVAGILTEGFSNFETGFIENVIIGIGVNIFDNPNFFPKEISKIAGSIFEKEKLSDISVSRCQFIAEIAGEVLSIFSEKPESVMQEYKDFSFLTGKKVNVHPIIDDPDSSYEAKVIGIDDNACLIVQLKDGSKKLLNSGEVTLHEQ
ncbi:MAG: biotin--[acetyl-CoA-carboxylase] ligase [Treponemataceae bacterium]